MHPAFIKLPSRPGKYPKKIVAPSPKEHLEVLRSDIENTN